MTNAKTELLEILTYYDYTTKNILAAELYQLDNNYESIYIWKDKGLDISVLDFNYDDGYGTQRLHGTILLDDNSWLSRGEYDGSEWWEHNQCPTIEDVLEY